jgi:hypothetical protein
VPESGLALGRKSGRLSKNRRVGVAFQIFKLLLGFSLVMPSAVLAQETCPAAPSLLVSSCDTPVSARLRILPDETVPDARHLLTVAGTYSSGDRFGIEGLVIQAGTVVSHRYKSWDGVLIIDGDGVPQLFNAKNVSLNGERFNLKQDPSRDRFIDAAKAAGVSVLQSHLLISDGELDLNDVSGAPKFIRRLLVTFKDGNFGIWQTKRPETLFDAATQLKAELAPWKALNLDMGAYDYCRAGPPDAMVDCGRLLVSSDKLTNLLEFTGN